MRWAGGPGVSAPHIMASNLPTFLLVYFFVLNTNTAQRSNNSHKADEIRNIFGWFTKSTTASTPTTRSPIIRSCDCVCGIRNDGSRIVGGQTTMMNEFPWMVRLSYFNKFYCGGALINDRYVITAAHCVKGFMWFLIKVTLGEHDQCNKTRQPETRFVLRATIGDFSFFNFRNDIALLRLNDRVPVSDTIRPICLPTNTRETYEGKVGTVTGWGTTTQGGKISCELQEVEIPIISNENCKKQNYSAEMIWGGMLCAGYPEGEKDSCQGDSGGPMAIQRHDNKYELIGVVSWGEGCARPGYPGVYTRVTRYMEWIQSHTRDGCFCDKVPQVDTTEMPTTPGYNSTDTITTTKSLV